jgi:hypothetical protein
MSGREFKEVLDMVVRGQVIGSTFVCKSTNLSGSGQVFTYKKT